MSKWQVFLSTIKRWGGHIVNFLNGIIYFIKRGEMIMAKIQELLDAVNELRSAVNDVIAKVDQLKSDAASVNPGVENALAEIKETTKTINTKLQEP